MTKKATQKVEVSTDFSRTCAKCRETIWAEPVSFRLDERTKIYWVDSAQFPPGWLVIYASAPTAVNYALHLCRRCGDEVLRFIGVDPADPLKLH